jgi:hypothetical protein
VKKATVRYSGWRGGGQKFLLHAAEYGNCHNSENGELYAVFPYLLSGIAEGNTDIAIETVKRRIHKNSLDCHCRSQDRIHCACAGMRQEAADELVHRWTAYGTYLRFPFFGRERPDCVPDLDYNGAGNIALQRMIVQESGDKIFLLPAWIPERDATFKLRLRHNMMIQGSVRNGRLESWSIAPESRRKDVKVIVN